MRDVLFYDFDFNLLADFPRVISLNIEKKYCGYGTAELHFSLKETEVLNLLENNQYLFFVSGEHSAIVTGWKVSDDIAIFGRTPEWLLTKRGIAAFSYSNENTEMMARGVVNSAAGDFMLLGSYGALGIATDNYSTAQPKLAYDVVCEMLKKQKLGFEVTPIISSKKFRFDVYSGTEKPLLLSKSNRTAYDMVRTVEKQDMVTNSGWYERKMEDMGDWDTVTNSPLLVNTSASNAYKYYKITSEDYTRFGLVCTKGSYLYSNTANGTWKVSDEKPDDVWLRINNTSVSGAKRWDAVLSGTKTLTEAVAALREMSKKEATTTETRGAEYGTDYNLGDVVRVQFEAGDFKKTEKKRVTAVNVYYDVDKSGVSPTLSSLEE